MSNSIAVKYNPAIGLYQTDNDSGVDFGSSRVNGNFHGTFSGSHTALDDGTPAFVAGANMQITTTAQGAVNAADIVVQVRYL